MRQLSGSRIVCAEERIGVSAAKSNMSPPTRDARESPHVTRCQVDPGLQKAFLRPLCPNRGRGYLRRAFNRLFV